MSLKIPFRPYVPQPTEPHKWAELWEAVQRLALGESIAVMIPEGEPIDTPTRAAYQAARKKGMKVSCSKLPNREIAITRVQ